ncbi:unnamed protein product [Periconia digitata]|uniref:NB-ARC domain-containing protein n=1 Tax=Periconia digitata TaxID=1303443 RepID=A0A9W4XCR8_9PLEO|nr:unnamed protein product [Periconia digitata]
MSAAYAMDPTPQMQHAPTHHEPPRFGGVQIHQEGSRFGATHVTGGYVFQGNFVGLTINSAAASQRDYTGQFAHSSLEPVKAFVARDALHDQIHTQLNSHAAEASTTTLVVWGLGGAGKTQLVLDYVQRHRTEYKATFWIEVASKESLERDFINLYRMLFGLATSAGTETISIDDAVTGVKSWFSGRQGPWLMVFDGADAIEDSKAHNFVNIKHFIPDVASLHVIMTSRSSTAANMTRMDGVQVGEMEGAQAVELFYRYTRLPRDNVKTHEEVKEIVKELGCLALAVTLAGAYVGTTPRLQSNVKAYRPEYRQRRRELLQRKPESLVHQYSESVLTTWETSHRAVAEQCSEASVLMTMLSFLSFDDIFLGLFVFNGQVEMSNKEEDINWRRLISPVQPLNTYKIEECFRVLQKYSLVQWKADQQSYGMHKLVHAWGCDRLTRDEQARYSRATFGLIVEAVEMVESGRTAPEDKLRIVPHVMVSFAALGNRGNKVLEGVIDELEVVGLFLHQIGKWREGLEIQEVVLDGERRIFGEEHPSTIAAMNNFAGTLRDQGQLDEAAKMFEEVLDKTRRILGEEHSDTIAAMNNFASTLRDQGQLDEAAKIEKEVLKKRRRILGEEHPDTISVMNNLAITLGDQGQLDEAAKLKKEVLKKMRRILGEEHPSTISAMNNLAATLGGQGHLDEAASMKREVVEKTGRILGEEHPFTISATNNLANTLRDQGHIDKAAEMRKEVLEKTRRILGEEHPSTISAMNNLAATLGDQGQIDEAAEMRKEVLEKRRRILGEEHPSTISAMNNLANTLGDQGHIDKAAEMRKEVLEKRRRILGEEHPSTISAMSNLAITLRDQGHIDKAAEMRKEVLEKRRRILGEEHPDTIMAMSNLAATLGDQGHLDEAAQMDKEVVEKRRRILGEEHPDTRIAEENLAIIVQRQRSKRGRAGKSARKRTKFLQLIGMRPRI